MVRGWLYYTARQQHITNILVGNIPWQTTALETTKGVCSARSITASRFRYSILVIFLTSPAAEAGTPDDAPCTCPVKGSLPAMLKLQSFCQRVLLAGQSSGMSTSLPLCLAQLDLRIREGQKSVWLALCSCRKCLTGDANVLDLVTTSVLLPLRSCCELQDAYRPKTPLLQPPKRAGLSTQVVVLLPRKNGVRCWG